MKLSEKGVFLGHSKGKIMKRREYLSSAQINHHVHVVGASGYGKSVLLSKIIKDRIARGEGVMFIDLKADRETIDQVKSYADEFGRKDDLKLFSISNPDISNTYNPLLEGSANQIRDRLVGAMEWSEEYYKQASMSHLLKVLSLLCWSRDELGISFSIKDILNLISQEECLEDYLGEADTLPDRLKPIAAELVEFFQSKDRVGSLMGIRAQLESLIYSDFQDLIISEDPEINIFEAINKQQIVYLLLDSRRYGESAKVMGKLILGDLKAASARIDNEILKKDRKPFTVIIDEFADLATEDFLAFLDRARSARIGVIVAHQELGDLQRVSPEFARRLMGNTSTMFAFLQKNPDSAEIIAKVAGTYEQVEYTSQTKMFGFWNLNTGNGSARRVETFKVHPNQVKSLRVGECISICQMPKKRSERVFIKV